MKNNCKDNSDQRRAMILTRILNSATATREKKLLAMIGLATMARILTFKV